MSEDKSDANTYLSDIFSDDGQSSDSETDSHSSNEDSDSDSDLLLDNGGQHPPGHYLAEGDRLNVSQLRQHRYSPKTQKRLDETRGYWDQ